MKLPFFSLSRLRWVALSVVVVLFVGTTASATPGKLRKYPGGVPGRYIVMLSESTNTKEVDDVVGQLSQKYGLEVKVTWRNVLRGFACAATEQQAAALAEDHRVAVVEQELEVNSPVEPSGMQWANHNYLGTNYYLWHLDRIDELTSAQMDSQYDMCPEARGVVAYVIDNGVSTDHEQFEPATEGGRVKLSIDATVAGFPFDTSNACAQTAETVGDWTFHGTGVASTLAGTTVGASKPIVVSLRVRECGGRALTSYSITAFDFIQSSSNPYVAYQGVANFSSTSPLWAAGGQAPVGWEQAIRGMVFPTTTVQQPRYGVPLFTSANNFSIDACNFAPAHWAYTNTNTAGFVFTVAGTDVVQAGAADSRWQTSGIGLNSGSNGGACVSAYAPAASVFHAKRPGDNSLYTFSSGTSYSAPLAAGVAARYLERRAALGYARTAPQAVYSYLLSQAQTAVQNTNTKEQWGCYNFLNGEMIFKADGSNCVAGKGPDPNNPATPYHFPSVTNSSNAKMLYSTVLPCP
ncbi:MAG: S8 family serine peptidase [Thermoanaerobaculia bacterium]|nr:S8 family serine peptidase [Thermoanaerobaculia bacterium]